MLSESRRELTEEERAALDLVIGPDARGAYRQAEDVWAAAREFCAECVVPVSSERDQPGSCGSLVEEAYQDGLAERRAARPVVEAADSLVALDRAIAADVEPPFTNVTLQRPAYRVGFTNGYKAAASRVPSAPGELVSVLARDLRAGDEVLLRVDQVLAADGGRVALVGVEMGAFLGEQQILRARHPDGS